MSEKIIVGLSGGVDSSVTAYLLQQQGFDVHAVFMKNWESNDEHCPAEQDYADARAVAARLGIPLTAVNFADDYWQRVFTYFLEQYNAGRTPNPDVLCNREIKFRAFLDYALELGASKIATGHYARLQQHSDGSVALMKGKDANKDQSYFLHALNQQQLQASCFPLGEMEKSEVRAIAEQLGLITSHKKDSTGICFIGERKFKQFLSEFVLAQAGDMLTPEGECVGRHDGLMYYTLGQRQGLQIGGRRDAVEAPWYVLAKNIEKNQLIVGQGHDHPLLYCQEIQVEKCHWISGHIPTTSIQCAAKTRYRQRDVATTVTPISADRCSVVFAEPQRAVTPGQYCVFYQDDECLGGGEIV